MADITIKDVRAKYPQYEDLNDLQLADALHSKFYSDMAKPDFYAKVGLSQEAPTGFADLAQSLEFPALPRDPRTPPQALTPPAMPSPLPQIDLAGLMAPINPLVAPAAPLVAPAAPAGIVPPPVAAPDPAFNNRPAPLDVSGYKPPDNLAATMMPDPQPKPMVNGGAVPTSAVAPAPVVNAPANADPAMAADAAGYVNRATEQIRLIDARIAEQPDMPEEDRARLAEIRQQSEATIRNYQPLAAGYVVPEPVDKPGTVLSRTVKASGQAIQNVPANLKTGWYGLGLMRAETAQRISEENVQDQLDGAQKLIEIDQKIAAGNLPQDEIEGLRGLRKRLTPHYGEAKEIIANEQSQLKSFEEDGKRARKNYDSAKADQIQIDAEPGSPEYYISHAIGSSAEMAPALLASMFTGSPLPAMVFMAGYVGGSSYVEGRDEGLTPEQATTYAVLNGIAEGIPEALPVHVLIKPGTKIIKRMISGVAAETVQESFTEALQAGIDKGYIKPDMTWKEARHRIVDAGIIGGISGGVLAGGVSTVEGGVKAAVNLKNRDRRGGDDEASQPPIQPAAPGADPAPTTPAPIGPAPVVTTPDTLASAMLPNQPPSQTQNIPEPVGQPAPPVVADVATPETTDDFEIIDEIETVDGETVSTGRQVRLNTKTGEVSLVVPDAHPVQPKAVQSQPQAAPDVGTDDAPVAGDAIGTIRTQTLSSENVGRIETDAKTFQYKDHGDEAGVTDRLRGVKDWDERSAMGGIVYEYADGRRVVADGHQRLGLARKLQAEGKKTPWNVEVIREVDGFTPDDVRRIAALKNIREGSGTAIDAAKILREVPDQIESLNLPPNSALVRDAKGLAKLSSDGWGMIVNEVVTPEWGAAVGENVPNTAMHADIIGLLKKLQPKNNAQAAMIARQAGQEAVTETQTSLFGDEQITQNLYLERARVLDAALKRLKQDKQTFKVLSDRADTITQEGNVLNSEANAQRVDADARAQAYLSAEANRKGPISDALSAAAKDLKANPKQGARIVRDFLAAIRNPTAQPERTGSDRAGADPERGTKPQGVQAEREVTPPAPAVAPKPAPGSTAGTYVDRSNGRLDDDIFRSRASDLPTRIDPDKLAEEAKRLTLEPGKRDGIEYLMLIDGNGQIVAYGSGTKNGTGAPGSLQLVADPGERIVAHHNHPRSSGFSGADFAMTLAPGTEAVIAYGHDGSTFRASTTDLGRAMWQSRDQAEETRIGVIKARLDTAFDNLWKRGQQTLLKALEHEGQDTDSPLAAQYQRDSSIVRMLAMRDAGIVEIEITGPAAARMEDDTNIFLVEPELKKLYYNLVSSLKRISADVTAGGQYDRRTFTTRHPGDLAGVPVADQEYTGKNRPKEQSGSGDVQGRDRVGQTDDQGQTGRDDNVADPDFDAALDQLFGAPSKPTNPIEMTPPPKKGGVVSSDASSTAPKRSKADIAKDMKNILRGGMDEDVVKFSTDTAAFKRWFGDSKVVDEDGEPLHLWHGTARPLWDADFEAFNGMVWASEGNLLPMEYASMRANRIGEDKAQERLIELFMRVERPFNADLSLPKTVTIGDMVTAMIDQAEAQGRTLTENQIDKVRDLTDQLHKSRKREESGPHYDRHDFWYEPRDLFGADGAKVISEIFEITGFDGVKMLENGEQTWGAFKPEQVKSPYNRGTFDPADANMFREDADLFAATPDPNDPSGAQKARDKAEIAARQQQSKIRRTGQSRVEDDSDSLFGHGRQGDMFKEDADEIAALSKGEQIARLNKFVEGWTSTGDMLVNKWGIGGIIDKTIATGEWFVVFNDDKPTIEGLSSRAEAIAAFLAVREGKPQAKPDPKYAQLTPLFIEALDGTDPASMSRQEAFVTMIRPLADAGLERDDIEELKPYFDRFLADVKSGMIDIEGSAGDAPGTSTDLERDRGDAGSGDRLGGTDVPVTTGADGRGANARGRTPDTEGGKRQGGGRLSDRDAAGVGATRDTGVLRGQRTPRQFANDQDGPGGRDRGKQRLPPDDGRASDTAQNARNAPGSVADRKAAQITADKGRIIPGDADNIAQSLPLLLPEQHDDVWKIEQRFAKTGKDGEPIGHGMLITNGTGTGKAQPLDAGILTPSGWRQMGQISVGDSVVAVDGSAARVIGVYPQGEKPIYRVRFSDGTSTECCDEHLWETQTLYERRKSRANPDWNCAKPKVRSLADIRATLKAQHFVPVASPVEHPARRLDIRPYTLGVILGDGCIRQNAITISGEDEEVFEYISGELSGDLALKPIKTDRCRTWRISQTTPQRDSGRFTPHPMMQALRIYGLAGAGSANKFIPEDFLLSSVGDRVALLQGLMDTDGTIDKRSGSVSFCTVSRRLADGFAHLVRSLGGTCGRSVKDMGRYQDAYILTPHLPNHIAPFRVSRKALHVRPKAHDPRRKIVSVDLVGTKQAQCIAIDHPRHLYVTDDYVVTHNTYSGGGVIKRFAQQGKTNTLIMAPSQGILDAWVEMGRDMGLDISKLEDSKSSGAGIVATTYANAGDNPELANREWDLVVSDESQKLSSAKDGGPTAALEALRAITNRPDDLWRKVRMQHADELAILYPPDEVKGQPRRASPQVEEKRRALEGKMRAEVEALRKTPPARSKVLFLSATPFAYDKSVDYGSGYLFEYGSDGVTDSGSRQSGQNLFMVENFGYRIRYHKLTKPEAAVDNGVFEREFHERLKREGVLSGRQLDIDADYDRKFVKIEDVDGEKIDAALALIRERSGSSGDGPKWRELGDHVSRNFTYLRRLQLLEAIKAQAAIPDIKAHLALGRKVVVFHDYNKGGGMNPFTGSDLVVPTEQAMEGYALLLKEMPEVADLNFEHLSSPIETLSAEFGKRARVYNGTVSGKDRKAAMSEFNRDNSGVDVIIVQSAAGEAGISLHDTSGTHQRVLINLGMPVRPTTTLQEEGRIRRVGSVTDASFRYLTTGTAWERQAFAGKIADNSGTVENLALGDEARAIRDAFINAYMDADAYKPSSEDGKGGRDADRSTAKTTPYEQAKTHYYGRTKNTRSRDNRQGFDFYATPEPLGFKMAEWAGVRTYERVLEPSAGDGAIARYLPVDADRTIIEPSLDLLTKAQLRANGVKAVQDRFEDHHIVNKYDAVVMNPPFGSGGKTAMDHLAKAMKHVKPGGRVVALIPTGPAADKQFMKMMQADGFPITEWNLTADISLPPVTFEKAGTSVAAHVVIFDRAMTPDNMSETKHINMRGADTIAELFDRLEHIGAPERAAMTESSTEVEGVVEPSPVTSDKLDMFEFKNTRTGADTFGVQVKERLGDKYKVVADQAKFYGGYYSKYQNAEAGAKRGFLFPTAQAREGFIDTISKPWFGLEETAYHGTPHDFDKFSTEAMGIGEGAQAFGWGMYFASLKQVAQSYRDGLSSGIEILADGRKVGAVRDFEMVPDFAWDMINNAIRQAKASLPARSPEWWAEGIAKKVWQGVTPNVDGHTLKWSDTIGNVFRNISPRGREAFTEAQAAEVEVYAEAIRDALPEIKTRKAGRLYTVEIPEASDLLDWDKPITQQPGRVADTVKQLTPEIWDVTSDSTWLESKESDRSKRHFTDQFGWQVVDHGRWFTVLSNSGANIIEKNSLRDAKASAENARKYSVEAVTGQGFYKFISRKMGGDKAASEALRAAGIPGHRYLDGGSRSDGQGSHNYVIYDNNAVQITAKEQRGAAQESEAAYEALADAMPALRAELDRLNLKRVDLGVDTKGGRRGAFLSNHTSQRLQILVAPAMDVGALKNTLHHEAIHALRGMNLFTPAEWKALEIKAARSWVEQYDIVERYPDLLPSEQIEEAIAEAFADAAATKTAPKGSLLVQGFNKIGRLLKAIGNALRGAGFQTADAVFNRVASGEVGARPVTGLMTQLAEREARFPKRMTPQQRAHNATAMGANGGYAYIPDRRIWEELSASNAGYWQRLRSGASAAHDYVDKARIKMQDRFLPVLRAQEAVVRQTGQALPEDHNAYLAEETFSGKVGRHLFEIDEDYTKPMIDIMAGSKRRAMLDTEHVGTWLYARHAQERNARIASINPNMPDGGSGMTNAEAAQIMADAAAGPHAARLQEIGELVDALRERTLRLREDAGLITAQEAGIWRNQYKHYVPLKGFSDTDHSEAMLDVTGVGRRFNTRGPESKAALGRQSEAFNPLQAAITQAQEVAIRAEKNRVGQAMLKLARDYPSPRLWSVKTPKMKRYYNRTTGMVESRVEDPVSLFLDPNETAVKVDGKEHRVLFHDPRLARAAGSVGADQMGWFMSIMSQASRWFSSVNTMLNPEFVIRNAFRDMTTAQVNIRNFGKEDRNAIAAAMIKNWPKAFAGAYRGQLNKADSQWTRYYKEFEKSGAKVSFWKLEQPKAGKKDIARRVRMAGGGIGAQFSKYTRISTRDNPVLGFIERTNLAVDNAIRLAAYVETRQRGWSESDAASLSKNLTVNFNRRGEWGATINALYPFANAGIQGTQILFKAMTSKRMAKYALGMVALGVLLDQVNAALSAGDEDDDLAYDKIPDWKNQMNMVVMLGPNAENAATIWMPYGYNLFPYIGQQISKVMRGVKEPEDAMVDFAAAMFGSFSPLGGRDLQSVLTPTMLDPINEMAMNEDWLGRPIRPESPYDDFGPDAYKYYGGVTTTSRTIADIANRATGGTIAESGLIDVSPEYIDHAFGFATGGAGRFWGQTSDIIAKLVSGEAGEIEAHNIPFYRSVQYKTGDYLDRDRYYRFREVVEGAKDAAKTYHGAGISVPDHIRTAISLDDARKEAEKQLRALRKIRRGLDARDDLSASEKSKKRSEIDERSAKVYLAFNKRYIGVMGPQGE